MTHQACGKALSSVPWRPGWGGIGGAPTCGPAPLQQPRLGCGQVIGCHAAKAGKRRLSLRRVSTVLKDTDRVRNGHVFSVLTAS